MRIASATVTATVTTTATLTASATTTFTETEVLYRADIRKLNKDYIVCFPKDSASQLRTS